ncbi:MAG: LytTR family DNA-binding domain-containing protein [Halothiobacillaceae bacterium]|jgi:two-component system response regulator AlgR|nr:LytTR family DNA-binding domain-containing protein [Halothiobacillaceae bacterium]
MRILIADDEPLARERLARLLADLAGCEVVGEAADGEAVLASAPQLLPDVVLLDIDMPGPDGLEVARRLGEEAMPPAVIFVTAHPEHALSAFETHASDYLLKPVRVERLRAALERVARLNRAQVGQGAPAAPARTHVVATLRGRRSLIPIEDVDYFEAGDKYVTAHHGEGESVIDEPLKLLEAELGGRFLRVHRGYLVSVSAIRALAHDGEGHHWLTLRGRPERIEVSRRHLKTVRELIDRLSIVGG